MSVYNFSGTVNVIIDIVGFYRAAGSSGGSPSTTVVETGPIELAAYDFVSGELDCPPGTTPVGTGVRNKSIFTTVLVFGDFVGYFLANELDVVAEVEAQAVCMSGVTSSALTDGSAALEDATADEQEWQAIVEDLKAQHARANELRIHDGG